METNTYIILSNDGIRRGTVKALNSEQAIKFFLGFQYEEDKMLMSMHVAILKENVDFFKHNVKLL